MEIEEQKGINNKSQSSFEQIPQQKINEIKQLLNEKNNLRKIPAKVLNRRYKKLQKLIDEDEFFSEESVKMRQYMKTQGENLSNLSFADFLEELMMKEEYRQQLEEEYNSSKEKNFLPKKMKYDQVISEEEREDNEDDLIRLMHTKFLIGEEQEHFNYEEIDNDETLDDRKIVDQDEEDKYFDDEEEDEINPNQSEYTGVEDY